MVSISKFIILIIFTFSLSVYAQVDTLNYIKQFETNKLNFVNKPLSYLLNQMTLLQPKSVESLAKVWNKNLANNSCFEFRESSKILSSKPTVHMVVYWTEPISFSQALLLSKQNNFAFGISEQNFYGNRIIKDIKVFKR